MTLIHKHSRWGSHAAPCHTVCGRPCDSVQVEYLHPERVNCPDCITNPDHRA